MSEPGRGLGLARYPLARFPVARARIDHLDRDIAVQALVPGAVDGPVAAAAEALGKREPGENAFADHFQRGSSGMGAFLRQCRADTAWTIGTAQWQPRCSYFSPVAFLDEEEELEAQEEFPEVEQRGPRGPRPPRTPRQQIMMRRLVAVGAGGLLLILLVLAFRGCLDARKERAIRNFTSDVGALMAESEQVGTDFFGLLQDSGGRTALEYEAEVKSFRGASETLYDRAQELDAPDDLAKAKANLVLTLELRRNALTAIGNNIGPALGKENATDAQKAISDQMKLLFASDQVCTGVAVLEIARVTEEEGVSASGEAPFTAEQCEFVPEPAEEWLDLTTVTDALGQVTGDEPSTSGIHGLEIVQTSIGGTQLLPDTDVTVSAADPTLTIEILNGGESEESDINVSVTVGDTDLPQTIPTIGAQESIELEIPITPVPSSGEQLTSRSRSTRFRARRAPTTTRRATRSCSSRRCGSPISGRPGRSPRMLCAPRPQSEKFEEAPAASIHEAIMAVESGESDRALVPVENSIEGVGPRHSRHACVRHDRRRDRRRIRLSDPHLPDRPHETRARSDRGRPLPPAGERPVRELRPRAASRRRREAPRRALLMPFAR